MWIYEQRTGRLRHNDTSVATGYSGFGPAKNDPLRQHEAGLGPIPQGAYSLGAVEEEGPHGPVAIHLLPLTGTETFGRSAFMVHGDSVEYPGGASHGCIIVPRKVREAMADGRDRLLVVLSGNFLEVA